ncbi:hypothetical protein BJ138DRAFT_1116472 [Hygrophoropsis aurantiaca]|uniref:Uncharacterized protein n=1 Tax=Hygrophoropsis aurantiaca TaxID=72124 RepID=A0ACB8A2X5_9AGAM|nr:hypothetical protein BJ138DRAFT_1116472 [Hygrophoropsis aurantiaca]
MDAKQRRALRILPTALQDVANKAIQGSTADLQTLYENITGHDIEVKPSPWLTALLPVFFTAFDPALIPPSNKEEYTEDELSAICRARWALKAVGRIFDRIPPKDGDRTSWERMFPWMSFLQTEFLLPDPMRDERLGMSFPAGDIAQTAVHAFSVICYAGKRNIAMIQSTPGATHLIAVLWLFVAHQHVDYGVLQGADKSKAKLLLQGAISLVTLATISPEAPEGMAALLRAAGTINRVLATTVRYVSLIADTVRVIKDPTSDNIAVVDVATNAIADCATFLESFKHGDPAHSHALVALGSVQLVTTTIRHIARLLLAYAHASRLNVRPNAHPPRTPIQRVDDLANAYQYLHFAFFHLGDGVTPTCHALNAGLLDAIFRTWLYVSSPPPRPPPNCLQVHSSRPKFAEYEGIVVLLHVIPCYFVYPRVLRALARALKHPAFREAEQLARADKGVGAQLWALWETLGGMAREYIALGLRAGPGTDGLHARRCAADNASGLFPLYQNGSESQSQGESESEDETEARTGAGTYQRCAGCLARTYCSKACQRADWNAGHRMGCGVLRNGLGTTTSPTLRRALPLISTIEQTEWARNQTRIRQAYHGYIERVRAQASSDGVSGERMEQLAVEIDLISYPRNIRVVPLDFESYMQSDTSVPSSSGAVSGSGSSHHHHQRQRTVTREEWTDTLAVLCKHQRRSGMHLDLPMPTLTVIKIWDGQSHEPRTLLSPGAVLGVFCTGAAIH